MENSNATLFYNSKKSLLSLYHTILQCLHIPNFYFPLLLIKIIYLHNKIIYLKIIYSLPSLYSLSFSALSDHVQKAQNPQTKTKEEKKTWIQLTSSKAMAKYKTLNSSINLQIQTQTDRRSPLSLQFQS